MVGHGLVLADQAWSVFRSELVLSIVRHVAANHGGDVRLWSRLGTGSTFTLRIPAYVASADKPDHSQEAEQSTESARTEEVV